MSTATAPAATPKPRTKPVKAAAPAAKPADDARKVRRAAILFKQMGDPTRLRVVLILADGGVNVGDLAVRLGISQPSLSHHLALARHSGLVETQRQGKCSFYVLTEVGRKMAEVAKTATNIDVTH